MSGFSTPQGVAVSAQPKQISSRLLNMKFMQRAAATTVQKSASTPSTPTGEPAPKRRRTGDFATTVNNLASPSANSTAASTPAYGDRTATSSILNVDGNGASIRRGTNNFDTMGEETEWVLDIRLPTLNGGNRSYDGEEGSDEDEDVDEEIWSSTNPRGRQTYGSFDKKKRKTTDSISGTTTTPSTNKSSKKRSRPDEDDDDLSSISSGTQSEDASEGEIEESPKPKKKQKPGTFDFKSEEDLKRIDAFDLQKSGFDSGFGRQRHGLAGGGGGGRVGKGAFGSPGHAKSGGQGKKHHKKARKTM